MEAPNAKALFLQGKLQELLNTFWDAASTYSSEEDVSWIIGALVFSGRLEEGRVLATKWDCHTPHSGRGSGLERLSFLICARFFLAVGETRANHHSKAKSYFAANLLSLRTMLASGKKNDSLSFAEFFAWQGVGFYHQLCGRYLRSFAAAEKAFEASVFASEPWARTLASDLKAHNLARIGRVSEGLRLLEWTKQYATTNNFPGMARAVEVSLHNYQALSGIYEKNALQMLETFLDSFATDDCYSRSALQLEIARQALLQGKRDKAQKNLAEAESFIAAHGQPRNKCVLWQRKAWLYFLEGDFARCLSALDLAESVLNPKTDVAFLVEVCGLRMQAQLHSRAVTFPDTGAFALELRQLEALTLFSGGSVSSKILARQKRELLKFNNQTTDLVASGRFVVNDDDPIGALFDRISFFVDSSSFDAGERARQKHELIDEILRSGTLVAFRKLFNLAPGERSLIFNVSSSGGLLVVDGSRMHFAELGSSPQMRLLATELARGPLSKKDILEKIWGYRYAAERHDPLVYALIKRFRKCLGSAEDLLTHDSGKYFFRFPLCVQVNEYEWSSAVSQQKLPLPKPSKDFGMELNHRLICMLEWAHSQAFVTVSSIQLKWGLSKATTTRDLHALVAVGLLEKRGKGRATTYSAV